MELATKTLVEHKGPIYMRTGRSNSETFFNKKLGFSIGKGKVLISGSDFYIIGCGVTTLRAYKAAIKLKKIGISVGVVNMSTIKPIDFDLLKKISVNVKAILTVEDHSIYGGLGSSVAEALSNTNIDVYIKGMRTFGESGEPDELAKKFGIDENSIYKEVIKLKSKYDKLKNKIALVVGGSGLIGTQITKKLLDNKAIVISTFNSSKSKIQNRKNLYSEKLNVLREKDLDIFFLKLKKNLKE